MLPVVMCLQDVLILLAGHTHYERYHRELNGEGDILHVEKWQEEAHKSGKTRWARRARYDQRLDLPAMLKLAMGTRIPSESLHYASMSHHMPFFQHSASTAYAHDWRGAPSCAMA